MPYSCWVRYYTKARSEEKKELLKSITHIHEDDDDTTLGNLHSNGNGE